MFSAKTYKKFIYFFPIVVAPSLQFSSVCLKRDFGSSFVLFASRGDDAVRISTICVIVSHISNNFVGDYYFDNKDPPRVFFYSF